MTSPIRPTDDAARHMAQDLIAQARFCAIGVIEPGTGTPMVTRVALGTAPDRTPISLISSLSQHTAALRECSDCSILVGEPGEKGDPLTHPRLTIQATAALIPHGDPTYAEMAAHYLRDHPKAKLYLDFADFNFARFTVRKAFLNGGFGKAFHLTSQDLGLG